MSKYQPQIGALTVGMIPIDFLYLNLYEDALQKSIEQFSMNL